MEYEVTKRQYAILEGLRSQYQVVFGAVRATGGVDALPRSISKLADTLSQYTTHLLSFTTFQSLCSNYQKASSGVASIGDTAFPVTASLSQLLIMYNETKQRDVILVTIGKAMGTIEAEVPLLEQELARCRSEFDKMACPTCGTRKGEKRV